ncbi:hypothetical protein [Streptosporangium sp. NPDC002721]|uniref:hypothetical protein n=1 Tax=Streptosporangium sp. NPDC002721 TaxID=3366188 RepID=UPI00367D8B8B
MPADLAHRAFATGGSCVLRYAKDELADAEGAPVVRPGASLTRVTAAGAREVFS